MQNMYGNSMGRSKQANTLTNDMDDDDDDDYENANPCDSAPVVPSRKTRRIKNAMKEDLALKRMEKPAKQAPSVWTTPQKEVFPKQTPSFQPPPIGLDFSSGAVNAAFSDIEVMPNRNKQRCGRSMLVVLMWLMFIMFIAFGVITGFIFLHYITVSGKVASLEQTASDFQKNSEEEQGDLKTKVANLSNMMGNLQDTLMANIKHINKTLETVCTWCPVGWSVIGPSCYFVSREEITWDNARDECYKMNSVLVMIKDKTESDSLKQLYNINKRYWIGLRRDSNEAHIWKWLDGTQVTFTNWAVNEPNYHGKEEDCGETISGPWNDRPCSNKLFYICKRVRTC
ncbi:C-type lectin domain family 4 member G-like isoform X2 [Bufo gargarizans]|uniref:C-type lectin domain family 4 member G-like isoform X2 n=1 Tax=Bufo gargarizans TaxID=30331 RepID=UPI001CF58BB6|nr:C-type lectin domain family 4 member G-like isoform X2 [Bufo gargarizans]